MKGIVLKVILFVLCSIVELTVQAHIVNSPEGCSGIDDNCIIKNISDQTIMYNFEDVKVKLSSRSMMRVNYGDIKLLKGEFIVECLLTCLMSSVYVDKIQVNQGSFYFKADMKKNTLLGLSGDVVHQVRGKGRFVLLPAMIQDVELGGVAGPQTELPMVASDEELASLLKPLSSESAKLIKNLAVLKKQSIEALAQMNKQIIERKIANYKSDTKKRQLNKKNYSDESDRLRLLFRKKNSAY